VPNSVNFEDDDFHKYNTDFEDEALKSSNSLLTEGFIRRNQEEALTDPENAQLERVYERL
jgi:aminoglycoside/choline kinase family phosphotransferase